MRLINADALIDEVRSFHCADCGRRKGMKKGKLTFVYEIGEAPCRACEICDAIDYLENAHTVDAVPVVRCKDCKYGTKALESPFMFCGKPYSGFIAHETDYYCANGERR